MAYSAVSLIALTIGFSSCVADSISLSREYSQGDYVSGVGTQVVEAYLQQRLDHSDRLEKRMFKQRYFLSERYWAGPGSNAPVFLCVGGEGPPLTSAVLDSSVHCDDMLELASEQEALVLALEHRYYGMSNPGKDWSTESLRWLSSQQALSDIVYFHGFITQLKGLTGNEKWVTWGGSYPGMLSAWAHLKYPHLIHASVSSSSPLLAQLDFPQYSDVVRDSLASEVVGGSEECASAVESGHADVGELLKSPEGRQGLISMFDLCNSQSLEDPSAQVLFAGDGVISLPIQENDPACQEELCNIQKVCAVMTDASLGSNVERLAVLRKQQRSMSTESGQGDKCEVFPPTSSAVSRRHLRGAAMAVKPAALGDWVTDPTDPDRAWLYQTCTEFGFYQTCEVGTKCPFTQGLHTLEKDLQLCVDAFGITPDEVRAQVEFTNLYYGGINPRGSRVIFPNGDIDPWHALGVLKEPMPGLPVLYVKGASHHFWTHPSKSDDSPEVVKARTAIWAQVTTWLEEEEIEGGGQDTVGVRGMSVGGASGAEALAQK